MTLARSPVNTGRPPAAPTGGGNTASPTVADRGPPIHPRGDEFLSIRQQIDFREAVSYTHLTLPTKRIV